MEDNLKTWEKFSELMCSKYGFKKEASFCIYRSYVKIKYEKFESLGSFIVIKLNPDGTGKPVIKDIALPCSDLRLKTCRVGSSLAIVVYEDKTEKIIGAVVSVDSKYTFSSICSSSSITLSVENGKVNGVSTAYVIPNRHEECYLLESLKAAIKKQFIVLYNFMKLADRGYPSSCYLYFVVDGDEVGIYLYDSSYIDEISYVNDVNEWRSLPDMIPVLKSSGKEELPAFDTMRRFTRSNEYSIPSNVNALFNHFGIGNDAWLSKFKVHWGGIIGSLTVNDFVSLRPVKFADLEGNGNFRWILQVDRPDLLEKVLGFLRSM